MDGGYGGSPMGWMESVSTILLVLGIFGIIVAKSLGWM